MSSLSSFPIYRFVWISRKSVLRISQTREDDCGARLGPSFFEEEGTKEEKKKKKKGKKRIAYFSFQSARIRVFVDPLLRARLRARLVHARGNARGFLSFPTSSLCPSSVSCLLLSSLLSLSLSGPRGRQEAVTAWQRALLHINFFPSSAIPAPNAFAFHGHARRLFSAGTASRVASRFIIVFSFFSSYFYWTDLFFPLKREILISMEWFVISREVVERGRLFY